MLLIVLDRDGTKYIGDLVKSEAWDKPGTFRMTTGLPVRFGFPVRVIPRKDVAEIIEGAIPDIALVPPTIARDTITKVSGSKSGVVYEVIHRVDSDAWECSCVGFTYRKSCRHIGEAANSLKKHGK